MGKGKKLLVIVGPTGVGKTGLGVEVGREFGGEVVSADSRQVYKYMDIGTGKELPAGAKLEIGDWKLEKKDKTVGFYMIDEVGIWMYDVIEPDQRFSAVEYARVARSVIRNIWERDKLPIIVGGTGFYIRTLLEGVETSGISADWELRGKLARLSKTELQMILKRKNRKKWENMNRSDRNNPRRLIRAIEIEKHENTKTQKHENKNVQKRKNAFAYKKINLLKIGLKADKKILYKRIDERVEDRVEKGVVKEIRKLLEMGYEWTDPGMDALGYKEWKPYFAGEAGKKEVIQRWKYDEHSYARRQMTWFRKDGEIIWYNINERGWKNRVSEKVKRWYDKNG